MRGKIKKGAFLQRALGISMLYPERIRSSYGYPVVKFQIRLTRNVSADVTGEPILTGHGPVPPVDSFGTGVVYSPNRPSQTESTQTEATSYIGISPFRNSLATRNTRCITICHIPKSRGPLYIFVSLLRLQYTSRSAICQQEITK